MVLKKEDLDLWKNEVLRVVDNKINRGKILFKRTWSQRLDGSLATELEKLKNDFVITVADKAQNNILARGRVTARKCKAYTYQNR